MKRFLIALVALSMTAACRTSEPVPQKPETSAPKPMPPGLDESAMDLSADPCDDFYRYACGGWLDSTEIPADRAAWSRGFATLAERNEKLLRELLEDAAAGRLPEGTPWARELGDYYATCMDEASHEQALPDLQLELKKLDAKTPEALARSIAQMHARGLPALFRFGATQDFKDVTLVIGEFDQGGLGLPDRDYYLNEDAASRAVREAYLEHVARMFVLLGHSPEEAAGSAETVMKLETELARASLTRVERRSPEKLYHRLERAGLKKAAPSFPWDVYLKELGAEEVEALNVTHPAFFEQVGRMAKSVPPSEWHTYLTWHFVSSVVPALPKAFQEEQFRFVSKALTGAKEDLPRWKKCVAYTDGALGHALAQPFVAKYFGADGKATTSEMVKEIEAAFARNLDQLPWMDAETKTRALEKLHRIVNKIGYPERWRDYDGLQIDRGSFLANALRADAFERRRDLAKIGKPVDRDEWFMTPPTVNAYYNPLLNEIVFPAGILQPPFFNREATRPVNFGAMGMVVGHEITHGFDDEGRKFDAHGNLNDWWTEASGKAFVEKAMCVQDLYGRQVAIDDIKVKGDLTLGENVADMGGLKLAYAAMTDWAQRAGERPDYRFTDAQQFFLGYAQSWCSKYRPEMARLRAATDPHAPPFLRVNVPLQNMKAFHEAFQCKPGDRMVLPEAERCEVW